MCPENGLWVVTFLTVAILRFNCKLTKSGKRAEHSRANRRRQCLCSAGSIDESRALTSEVIICGRVRRMTDYFQLVSGHGKPVLPSAAPHLSATCRGGRIGRILARRVGRPDFFTNCGSNFSLTWRSFHFLCHPTPTTHQYSPPAAHYSR